MKKVITVAILSLLISCKTTKQFEGNIFETLEENEEFITLKKKPLTLKNNGEIIKEATYSVKIPNSLKKTRTTVTTIPNTVEFVFKNDQRIIIVNNFEEIKVDKLGLSKDVFLSEIIKLNVSELTKSYRFKEKRFFGIQSNRNYFLIYINVKKDNLESFNNSIKSHEIFP